MYSSALASTDWHVLELETGSEKQNGPSYKGKNIQKAKVKVS